MDELGSSCPRARPGAHARAAGRTRFYRPLAFLQRPGARLDVGAAQGSRAGLRDSARFVQGRRHGSDPVTTEGDDKVMLSGAIAYLVLALIAAVFRFDGLSAGAASIARVFLLIFMAFFVVVLIVGRRPPDCRQATERRPR